MPKDNTSRERASEAAARKYRAAMNNGCGRLHEQMILAACRAYHDRGMANIIKVPEPFRVLTKNRAKGIATVRFTARAQPDFIGCLPSGEMIAFEAKYTTTDRLHFKAVTPTQAKALQDFHKMGAFSAVCVGIGDQYFMIPWGIFAGMKTLLGKQYIRAEDVQRYRVKFDGVVWFLDYMKNPYEDWPF